MGRSGAISRNYTRRLGRILYKFGLPLQIFAIAHQAKFSGGIWFLPLIVISVLFLGVLLASSYLIYSKQLTHLILTTKVTKILFALFSKAKHIELQIPEHRPGKGSFILASTLGSTGYLGLSIVPIFVSSIYSGWAALYSITQILFGSFGMGVLLANYYGSSRQQVSWLTQIQALLKVPALWAFLLGCCTRDFDFISGFDALLKISVLMVVGAAFLLTGIQIQEVKKFNCLNWAIVPTALKMLIIPGLTGLCLTWFGFTGDARLSMVLMSGMPTANTNLILAEQYNLDRQVTASSIALSTILLPLTVLVWTHFLE